MVYAVMLVLTLTLAGCVANTSQKVPSAQTTDNG